jgi:hypothetical protein
LIISDPADNRRQQKMTRFGIFTQGLQESREATGCLDL